MSPAEASDSADLGREPLNAQEMLAAVDDAIAEQGQWLASLHRAVVCRTDPPGELIAETSEALSEFGHWVARHGDDPLLRQQVFRDLWISFAAMHDAGREVLKAAKGQAVSDRIYDKLVNSSDRFLSNARRMRDAFRKAVSELDPLTGLSNRATMMDELEVEADRSLRSGARLCLALTDIDHFKKVNDTYGHAAGDEVLSVTASRFIACLRPYDSIYRYGGEEFLVALPNANTGTAISVLERLRTNLCRRPVVLEDGRELDVSASFGLAMLWDGLDLKQVIERADQALYKAKQEGRNRVVPWSNALEEDATSEEDAASDAEQGSPDTGGA